MTAADTQTGNRETEAVGGDRMAINFAVFGAVLLFAAGALGWIMMGPTLFHLMATGIGWLCM